jgi:prepilin-type N-terminal cleavage/methylation domain-containing protein
MTRSSFRHGSLATARDGPGGMGVAPAPSVIAMCVPRRRNAGFTLIEALVVLAMVGIMAAMVTVPVNNYYQRSHLETTARDLRTFLDSAYSEANYQHANVTLSVALDPNNDVILTLAPVTPGHQATLELPSFVKIALNPGSALPATWTLPSAANILICDTNGRAIDPVSAQQSRATQTFALTHVRMVDGSLTPVIRYDVQIYPLWRVTVTKSVL